MSKTRVAIAAEIFSPNLGDGLIFETMKYLYRRVDPSVEIIPIDISGRAGWRKAKLTGSGRLRMIAYTKRNASRVYAWINAIRLETQYRRNLSQYWNHRLAEADTLVIGGGQLLMDDHLEFPLKLSKLSKLAVEHGMPVHVSACGVGERWSPRGKQLILEVLTAANSISLRDSISVERMERLFGRFSPQQTADPAIWTAELYNEDGHQANKIFGLGVLNLSDLNLSNPKRQFALKQIVDFWLGLIGMLESGGIACELFSNGNLADEAFCKKLALSGRKSGRPILRIAERPLTPAELAKRIRRYCGIAAFRMHALLLAFTYQIPCVGFIWDEKVRSLFAEVQEEKNCFDSGELLAEIAANRIMEVLASGVEYRQLEHLKEMALRNVQIVLG